MKITRKRALQTFTRLTSLHSPWGSNASYDSKFEFMTSTILPKFSCFPCVPVPVAHPRADRSYLRLAEFSAFGQPDDLIKLVAEPM